MNRNHPCAILIVDDEEGIRNLLKRALEKDGEGLYTIHLAENGSEAWELLQHHAVDVLVCDVIMPKMDGDELCRRVKGAPQFEGIYFIMLTKVDTLDHRLQGLNMGADDYISKPFSIDEFLARTRVAARLKHLQKRLLAFEKTDSIHLTVRTLSHEINNPLSIILTEIEVMKRSSTGLPDAIVQGLESIRENINRVKQALTRLETLAEPVVRQHGDTLTTIDL